MARQRPARHVPRVHVTQPLQAGEDIELPADKGHHLRNVLRARPGDPLVLFDGHGGEWRAVVAAVDKRRVTAHVEAHVETGRESPLRLTLAQGVARGDRMDFAIAKAVELGVTAIQPLFTERGKVRLKGERLTRKSEHWRRVAISAAEQSGRERVPAIAEPQRLDDWLSTTTGDGVVLAPGAGRGLSDLPARDTATLLVGPESGLSEAEIERAVEAGLARIDLGPRTLRTETAGIAALAALQTIWGDLG